MRIFKIKYGNIIQIKVVIYLFLLVAFINYQDTDCSNEDKMNTICFAGRLEEFKGIHLLKDILLEIIKQTDFNVVILKGSYFAKIEEIIIKHDLNGRVKLGYYTDIKHVLRNSVIFLSLQKEENYLSQSLLEAMACKKCNNCYRRWFNEKDSKKRIWRIN